MFGVVLFMVIAVGFLSWSWVKGIDYMRENHPDYKGEDFLNWGEDENKKEAAGKGSWDDNKIHTEGDF